MNEALHESDPLLEALARLRGIDEDYVRSHPTTADDDVARRVTDLWLTIAALDELYKRDEAADAESVRAEMERLDAGKFVFNPALLQELDQGFREDLDAENADTLAKAYAWMVAMLSRRSAGG